MLTTIITVLRTVGQIISLNERCRNPLSSADSPVPLPILPSPIQFFLCSGFDTTRPSDGSGSPSRLFRREKCISEPQFHSLGSVGPE